MQGLSLGEAQLSSLCSSPIPFPLDQVGTGTIVEHQLPCLFSVGPGTVCRLLSKGTILQIYGRSDTFIADQDRVLSIANCQQKIDENANTLMYRHQSCSALCEQNWQVGGDVS